MALDRPKYILTWRLERERKERKERKREVVNKYIYIYKMLAKYLQKTDYRIIYTYNNHKCWGGGKGGRGVCLHNFSKFFLNFLPSKKNRVFSTKKEREEIFFFFSIWEELYITGGFLRGTF